MGYITKASLVAFKNFIASSNARAVKGFTLIELLVVIAIIAVLSVVVILTLNPAELLRQARDSSRISNFSTMKSAISLFQADVATSSASSLGTIGQLFVTNPAGGSSSTVPFICGCASYTWGYASTTLNTSVGFVSSTNRGVTGGGWIPINFSLISSGSPIGNEPVDPTNASPTFYTYVASTGTVFKMAASLESTKYTFGGSGDAESTDGGNSTGTFEGGTNVTL